MKYDSKPGRQLLAGLWIVDTIAVRTESHNITVPLITARTSPAPAGNTTATANHWSLSQMKAFQSRVNRHRVTKGCIG